MNLTTSESSPYLPISQRMKQENWKTTLGESYALGCRKVQFIGGEPTLYPHLLDLIEFSYVLGYEFIEVFTNGTAFSERLKEAFQQLRVKLAFSVYSLEETIHDSVTLRSGSLARTLESIKWALGAGLSVRAAIIEMEANSGTVKKTSDFLKQLGVTSVDVDRLRGFGRGATVRPTDFPIDELCGKCWQGKLCVTSDGEVFPCIMARSWPVGNIIEQGLTKIAHGPSLFNFRSTLKSKLQTNTRLSQCHPVPPGPCLPQCGPDCGPVRCSPQGG